MEQKQNVFYWEREPRLVQIIKTFLSPSAEWRRLNFSTLSLIFRGSFLFTTVLLLHKNAAAHALTKKTAKISFQGDFFPMFFHEKISLARSPFFAFQNTNLLWGTMLVSFQTDKKEEKWSVPNQLCAQQVLLPEKCPFLQLRTWAPWTLVWHWAGRQAATDGGGGSRPIWLPQWLSTPHQSQFFKYRQFFKGRQKVYCLFYKLRRTLAGQKTILGVLCRRSADLNYHFCLTHLATVLAQLSSANHSVH